MANLLSPSESLASYFDELFGDDAEIQEDSGTEKNRQNELSSPAHPNIALPTKSKAPETREPTPLTQSKIIEVQPTFAEPNDIQREKLQKLLQSAPPKVQVETIAPVSAVVKVATQVEVVSKVDIAEVTPIKVAPVIAQPKVAQPNIAQPSIAQPSIAQPNIAQPKIAEPVVDVQTQEQIHLAMDAKAAEWLPNGRPNWAQSRFDVLLFQVSGLTLAVPLAALGQIQKITEELTPLFGQADWFMGLLPTPAGKIRTVNTAKFVMPERYDENFPKNAKLVVSINGVPWGLAVDSVNQPISIDPDQVKWRGDRTKRPWLAGTVKEHMCALLDIPTIGLMLQSADKNAYKSYG